MFIFWGQMCLSGYLPKLIEEARIAQMTAGELRAESILIKTVPATLKPFGNTGLTGFRLETKLRF